MRVKVQSTWHRCYHPNMSETNDSPTLPTLSEEAWALLHDLRLRGFRPAAGSPAEEQLIQAGVALTRGPNLALSPAGRQEHAAWARLPEGSEAEATARRFYDTFLPQNTELLRICTDWQLRPGGVPNDHTDRAYNWAIIERLERLDERVGALLGRVSEAVPRFAGYHDRLSAALAKIDEDRQWFASPRCDSYHTVWMQMHEDLLSAIGVDRADETQPE